MTAKDYLQQAWWLDQQIHAKLEQVCRLRELATRTTTIHTHERVNSTRQQYPMENAVVKLLALEKEIDSDIDKLVDLKREIGDLIEQTSSVKLKLVLEYRYFQGKTWDKIAATMNYDLRWIYRLHGKALAEVTRLLAQQAKIKDAPSKATVIH